MRLSKRSKASWDNLLRTLTIKINGTDYNITLQEEDFAKSIEKELEKELPLHHNNSVKDLLHAYFKKCYDCYLLEKKLHELLDKLQVK